MRLISIIKEQSQSLRTNVDEHYDDFFIKTCAEWATLYYRRRKGTSVMLEE